MKNILLFCDTIVVDIVLNLTKHLVKQNYFVYLQCEKIDTKKRISNFLLKNNIEKNFEIICLHEYLLENYSTKFEEIDFLNFEKKYNCKLSDINISTSEFNIYHNFFKKYESKLDIEYHLSARILLIENFYNFYFKNTKIDFALVECRNHFNTISGILFFKKNNIPCYVPTSSIFKDYFSVNEVQDIKNPFLEENYLSKDFNLENIKELKKELDNISFKRSTNDREKNYLRNRFETLKRNLFNMIYNFIKYMLNYNKFSLIKNFYLGNIHPVDLLKSRINKRINYYFYKKKLNERSTFSKKKKCVFFLGLSPEASTYSQCNIFFDQRKVARFIALNLPNDYELIVKEHPSQYISSDGRNSNYYDEILSHYNIKLAKPEDKAIDLIKNSNFVITSTGSVGIETILLKKKLIMLGNNHYKIFKNLYKAENYSILKNIISELTEQKSEINTDKEQETEILKFLSSYKKSYFPGNIEIFYKKKFLSHDDYEFELEKISNSFLKLINKLISN